MKADHEGRSAALTEEEVDIGMRLFVNQAVRSDHQSGGITAHTIQQTINVQAPLPALLSRRSTCLIACLSIRPRACASACPITETANDAPVRTPSIPLASERIRLECKLPENARFTKS